MKNAKPFWASKTLWVNTLAAIAAFAGVFGLDLGLTAEVQTQIVVGVMAVVNILLRLVTSSAVRVSGKGGSLAAVALLVVLAGCAGVASTPQGKLDVAKATYASTLAAMTAAADAGVFSDETIVDVLEPARAIASASIDAAEAAVAAPDFAGKVEAAFRLVVEFETVYRKVKHGREREDAAAGGVPAIHPADHAWRRGGGAGDRYPRPGDARRAPA